MKTKSLIVTVLTTLIALIGSFSGLFPASAQAWLGAISFALVPILSTFFPSGTLVSGWSAVMWATNIIGVIVQVLNIFGSSHLIDPVILNYIITGLNVFMQTFLKSYADNSGALVSLHQLAKKS